MLELIISISLHVGLGDDYKYVHPQVRYTTEENYIAGVYYNSVGNVSAYAGHRWESGKWGLEAGVVTGYNQAPVLPFVKVDYDGFFVMPAIDNGNIGAVLGYEFKF
tara:strand:+ start:456 stop:773 length:318 start_codon:yes stop_codon:yes gene_type:complete